MATLTSSTRYFTHTTAVCVWFALALLIPAWIGYLSTPTKYLLDIRTLFTETLLLLGITWLSNALLAPLIGKKLFLPLLGIVAALSALHSLLSELARFLSYQFDWKGLHLLVLLFSLSLYLIIWRKFLKPQLAAALLNYYSLISALPVCLLLCFSYMEKVNYFERRGGSHPSYHKIILPYKLPIVQSVSPEAFIKSGNYESKQN